MKKLVIGSSLVFFAAIANAEEHTLTTYSVMSAPEVLDVTPSGPSVGDMYLRRGEIALSADGPPVGEYYSQATIVYLDADKMASARKYSMEMALREGSIYAMDFVQTETANPTEKERDHKHEGTIIGGTGAYAGIRGTYTLEVLPSGEEGKIAKTVYTYWLGQ